MNSQRRTLLTAAGAATLAPFMNSWAAPRPQGEKLVLSDFGNGYLLPGSGWRGFSDRVMGGVSNARLTSATVDSKSCIRLSGNVTRERNGGFVQMAMYFGNRDAELDGTGYDGIELLVYGNNENYNVHLRTADCGWYDESYRTTFFAEPRWQRLRFPWESFKGNGISEPLDPSSLNRIAVLGWMREFQADVSLAEISLYA